MPRSYVIGNGTMLATFDGSMQMRDLYFPYVGMEDHTTYGKLHRLGIFVEGKGFAWANDDQWEHTIGYRLETLVTESRMESHELGLRIDVEDSVHPIHNILLRRLRIQSIDGTEKKVRIFFHHDFYIYGDKQKDTAFFEPYTNSVIHYRESRYFLIGGLTDNPQECRIGHGAGAYESVLHSKEQVKQCGISSFSIGKAAYRGLEGTWRDAEDGELGENPIEQGSVDSTVSIHAIVTPDKHTDVCQWLCLGKNLEEVVNLQEIVLNETPERLVRNTNNYWRSWVNKNHHEAIPLDHHTIELYNRSLLTIRMNCDNNGGIIAATDSDIQAFNRDTYTYVWPRDGALVALALDRAGYGEISHRFFEFCTNVQTPDGYLLHKYNPDGSVGSSWHPWYRDGEAQLPIQEDETALVLYALSRHIEKSKDFEFLQEMFEKFTKKAAQFLVNFREEESGLPLQSYDLWEEHRGIFTYTVATTIAGLYAAARMAHMLGHHTHSQRYHHVGDEMKQALLYHLYDEKLGRFVKKIKRENGETTDIDPTPDASIAFVWKLGILPVDDPRVVSTMNQLKEHLWVQTNVGGLARYTNDYYHQAVEPTKEIPGNPWIITTLWYAEWLILRAKTLEELEEPRHLLSWVVRKATEAGMLPEQLHPISGVPLSVSPLTWSHAAFVDTVQTYKEREKELRTMKE